MVSKVNQPRAIRTDLAAAPGGHYSQAIVHNGLVWISGQLPIRANGEKLVDAPFEEQAALALDNMLAVLASAGGAPADLCKVTVYIRDIGNWPAFDALYAARLGAARPARSVVPVPELHFGALIEIDAVAAVVAQP
jgi:2-iminobutanoate/2-iminopropanoate deaminase